MIAIVCQHMNRQKYGKTGAGVVRYRCKDCGKAFTESTAMFDGMRIGLDRAVEIVNMLCEGVSVSATARLTDTDPHTVIDLMVLVGERCESFMADNIQDVHVDDVQLDELWQFVFCKAATAERKRYVGGCGDAWCHIAVERHTKLILAWHHGRRAMEDTQAFCRKLAKATTGEFHLSSDAYGTYEFAVTWNLGGRVDYGQLVKIFGSQTKEDQRKYSPAKIVGTIKRPVLGNPERDRICTSHVERTNGSVRNFVKRMGRLTYCFSKRWDNHRAALGLFFAFFNYCRPHKTLRGMTPAMAHGLTTNVWSVREMLTRTMAA